MPPHSFLPSAISRAFLFLLTRRIFARDKRSRIFIRAIYEKFIIMIHRSTPDSYTREPLDYARILKLKI